jgi:hypothetical protein
LKTWKRSAKKAFSPTYVKGLFKDFTDFGKPFDYSGGLGINMRSYNALGTSPRQDPFLYTANANFNARVYKLNLPFSLTIAAKNTEHAYPDPKGTVQRLQAGRRQQHCCAKTAVRALRRQPPVQVDKDAFRPPQHGFFASTPCRTSSSSGPAPS